MAASLTSAANKVFTLTWIGSIDPPVVGGHTTQATDIPIHGSIAHGLLQLSKTVANAAYMQSGLLFTANREAGAFVYSVEVGNKKDGAKCKERSVTLLGKISFGAERSANHVYYRSGCLVVANGLGGVQFVAVDNVPNSNDDDGFDD